MASEVRHRLRERRKLRIDRSKPHPDRGLEVTMALDIKPLQATDLEDLSRFLTVGFHTSPDAVFATPAVLRWKYLDPKGQKDSVPCSYLARDDVGHIIGHVGICRTFFHGASIADLRVQTLHMIDWLGSPVHRSIGASLMRKAHEGTPTQFGLGGSEAGRTVIKRGGYEPRQPVAVYERVLQPFYWLRHPDYGFTGGCLHAARDLATRTFRPARQPRVQLKLKRVSEFSDEIEFIVQGAAAHVVLTDRLPERLNHFLRFPCQQVSGWHLLLSSGEPCGFALLNIFPQQGGSTYVGKIVDCLLPATDVDLWHAAMSALMSELAHQGADLAQAFASTPWVAEGLSRSGFVSRFTLEFSLRDRHQLIPHRIPVCLMPIEADYAYS